MTQMKHLSVDGAFLHMESAGTQREPRRNGTVAAA